MGKKESYESRVEKHLLPLMEEHGFELVDVEYVKEAGTWYLRAYIDKEGGVTIDDCEVVSKAVEVVLDEKDPISQMYILEVSSPGIDRPLKKDSDFVKYAGEIVDIKLYKAENGAKEFQGALKGLENNIVTITDESGNAFSFDRKAIASIRLAVIF